METSPLFQELLAKGYLDADDVLRVRREVFEDGGVSRHEVDAVFRLNQECNNSDETWREFFVDEMTYYFIYQTQPRGYMSDGNAQFLIDELSREGRQVGAAELELVVSIIHRAHHCPESLIVFALNAVKDSVLHPETSSLGKGRTPGVITGLDVQVIEAAIHGTGGGGSYTVTEREASLLFELSETTFGIENAESWPQLFAKGVGNYLLFPPTMVPQVASAEEILERREFFTERAKGGSFLKNLGSALARPNLGESFGALDLFGTKAKKEAEQRRSVREQAKPVLSGQEATWLISKVGARRSPELTDDDRALLAFIRERASSIHASLDPLMKQAGLDGARLEPGQRDHSAA